MHTDMHINTSRNVIVSPCILLHTALGMFLWRDCGCGSQASLYEDGYTERRGRPVGLHCQPCSLCSADTLSQSQCCSPATKASCLSSALFRESLAVCAKHVINPQDATDNSYLPKEQQIIALAAHGGAESPRGVRWPKQ